MNVLTVLVPCFFVFFQLSEISPEIIINEELGNNRPVTSIPEWKTSKQRDYELSYSQLHVMSDLLFEIALNKCPELNQTVGRKLKTFIRKEVARAPPKIFTAADADYFSLYTDLRECLQEMMEVLPLKNNDNSLSSSNSTQENDSVTFTSSTTARTIASMKVLSDLIRTTTMLARHICPFSHTTESQQILISSQVGNQILEWISKDQEGSADAAEYIQTSSFLDHLNSCHTGAMLKPSN